jgi:hypothetical protein
MSKVAITGNASGTGTFTLAAPNSNSDRTLTLPDNTGTILTNATTAGFPAGSVLQVVQATYSTLVSAVTSTYVDTGLTLSITPTSSSNKILILMSQQVSIQGGGADSGCQFQILRNSTQIYQTAPGAIYFYSATSGNENRIYQSLIYFDSPNTTSNTTYKLQGKDANFGSSLSFNDGNSPSTITLMEIAA